MSTNDTTPSTIDYLPPRRFWVGDVVWFRGERRRVEAILVPDSRGYLYRLEDIAREVREIDLDGIAPSIK